MQQALCANEFNQSFLFLYLTLNRRQFILLFQFRLLLLSVRMVRVPILGFAVHASVHIIYKYITLCG